MREQEGSAWTVGEVDFEANSEQKHKQLQEEENQGVLPLFGEGPSLPAVSIFMYLVLGMLRPRSSRPWR